MQIISDITSTFLKMSFFLLNIKKKKIELWVIKIFEPHQLVLGSFD